MTRDEVQPHERLEVGLPSPGGNGAQALLKVPRTISKRRKGVERSSASTTVGDQSERQDCNTTTPTAVSQQSKRQEGGARVVSRALTIPDFGPPVAQAVERNDAGTAFARAIATVCNGDRVTSQDYSKLLAFGGAVAASEGKIDTAVHAVKASHTAHLAALKQQSGGIVRSKE